MQPGLRIITPPVVDRRVPERLGLALKQLAGLPFINGGPRHHQTAHAQITNAMARGPGLQRFGQPLDIAIRPRLVLHRNKLDMFEPFLPIRHPLIRGTGVGKKLRVVLGVHAFGQRDAIVQVAPPFRDVIKQPADVENQPPLTIHAFK